MPHRKPYFEHGKNYFVLIKPGPESIFVEELTAIPSLEKLQEGVGGSIEIIPHFKTILSRSCVAFCNEEGKLNGLPLNQAANMLWRSNAGHALHDFLCGPVVIIVGSPSFLARL